MDDFFQEEIAKLREQIRVKEEALGAAEEKENPLDITKLVSKAKAYYQESFKTLKGANLQPMREALRALGVGLDYSAKGREGRLHFDHFGSAAT